MKKPCYGTISKNGSLYSLEFYCIENITETKQGYGKDIFKDCPENIPIIDFRTCTDVKKLMDRATSIFCEDTTKQSLYISKDKYFSLKEYLKSAENIGATIRLAKEFKN